MSCIPNFNIKPPIQLVRETSAPSPRLQVPIFSTSHWYVVMLYALLMISVGAWEAASRPAHSFKVPSCSHWYCLRNTPPHSMLKAGSRN